MHDFDNIFQKAAIMLPANSKIAIPPRSLYFSALKK
jgi:hypothetical protein